MELDRDRFMANPRLMKGKTWSWCVKELRDKAAHYKQHQYLRMLDTGSCVCKADSAQLYQSARKFEMLLCHWSRSIKSINNGESAQVRLK
jgi:hypothetical protein